MRLVLKNNNHNNNNIAIYNHIMAFIKPRKSLRLVMWKNSFKILFVRYIIRQETEKIVKILIKIYEKYSDSRLFIKKISIICYLLLFVILYFVYLFFFSIFFVFLEILNKNYKNTRFKHIIYFNIF